MSSVIGAAESIGFGGVFRSLATAVADTVATGNAKALGGIFEDNSRPPAEILRRIITDEAAETPWETLFSSMLAKLSKEITPNVPEQIAIIPGKLLGAAWHWAITSHQSINREKLNIKTNKNNNGKQNNLFTEFYDTFLHKPSEFMLKACGLGKERSNLWLYGASQLGVFGLSALALWNSNENLPGVNIDQDESKLRSLAKGFGYTIVEQFTYTASQITRFYMDFKEEFKTNVWAKCIANVINERFLIGHVLSGISASLSTYLLGKYIPKTSAAAIGEFPFAFLNRIVNCRRRRATKDTVGENNNRIPNYRFHDSKGYNKFLDLCDSVLNPIREKLIDLVVWISRGKKSKEEFKEEIKKSFNVDLKILKEHKELQLKEQQSNFAKEGQRKAA